MKCSLSLRWSSLSGIHRTDNLGLAHTFSLHLSQQESDSVGEVCLWIALELISTRALPLHLTSRSLCFVRGGVEPNPATAKRLPQNCLKPELHRDVWTHPQDQTNPYPHKGLSVAQHTLSKVADDVELWGAAGIATKLPVPWLHEARN